VRRGLALLAAAACAGCLGAIPAQEIPARPIALYWYDAETLRRRAEVIEESDPTAHGGSVGVARVEDIGRYVGELLGSGAAAGEEATLAARFPGRLALVDPRTEEVTPLEVARAGALPVAWSPDGRRLMFSQVVDGFRQLFEYDSESREVRRLTRGPGVHSDGCYGPEGRYVFARAELRGGEPFSNILLTQPGGGGPTSPLSEGPADYGPACAPDGSAVAWVQAGHSGRDTLVTRMPVQGGVLRTLGPGRQPAFSPDSEWIVFSAPVARKPSLFRIRADGSGRKAVGRSTLAELQPSFSPDGALVAYVADDGFHTRLYLRRFDGSGDRVLLGTGGGEYPVW
jgi:hypothetical protein